MVRKLALTCALLAAVGSALPASAGPGVYLTTRSLSLTGRMVTNAEEFQIRVTSRDRIVASVGNTADPFGSNPVNFNPNEVSIRLEICDPTGCNTPANIICAVSAGVTVNDGQGAIVVDAAATPCGTAFTAVVPGYGQPRPYLAGTNFFVYLEGSATFQEDAKVFGMPATGSQGQVARNVAIQVG